MTLVLIAWGIKEGDVVFVPDFTFFSTGEVVSFVGATPVFVDVDKDTFNIDTIKLENAITKVLEEGKLTPKVIIPVDLFGLPADYVELERIAKKYNLRYLKMQLKVLVVALMVRKLVVLVMLQQHHSSQQNHLDVMEMVVLYLLMIMI